MPSSSNSLHLMAAAALVWVFHTVFLLLCVSSTSATGDPVCLNEVGPRIATGYLSNSPDCSDDYEDIVQTRDMNHAPNVPPWWDGSTRSNLSLQIAKILKSEIGAEHGVMITYQAQNSRKRRGTTTTDTCFDRNSVMANGKLRICKECNATTDLGVGYNPRYVYEWICDSTDLTCFSGEGTCSESFFTTLVKDGSNNDEEVDVRTQCTGALQPGSVLTEIN